MIKEELWQQIQIYRVTRQNNVETNSTQTQTDQTLQPPVKISDTSLYTGVNVLTAYGNEHLKRLASVAFRDTRAHGLSGYPTNIYLDNKKPPEGGFCIN